MHKKSEADKVAYTVIDIIKKLSYIEEKACLIYRELVYQSDNIPKLKILASVLEKEEKRHVEYYKTLVEKLENEHVHEIDIDIYDKVSFLLDSFKSRITNPQTLQVGDLVKYSLDFERKNLAVLLDIQGRLVRSEADTETITYKTLIDIIRQEKTHIINLEKFVAN
jgi:rubrerythrin